MNVYVLRVGFLSFLVFLSGILSNVYAASFQVPALTSPVIDQAGILSPQTLSRTEQLLRQLYESGGTQIQVITLTSLEGLPIEDIGIKLADAWKLGRKGQDDGVILIIAPNDRRMRIEVGRGREGELTDALSRRIINEVIAPAFKNQDYDRGVLDGTVAIVGITDPQFDLSQAGYQRPSKRKKALSGGPVGEILRFIFIALFFGLFLVLRLVQSVLGGGPRSYNTRSGRGGYYGWGGGGWGGGSSGGGGWGGGGGGFGGGGSSGSW